ncbi:MAG: penicillin-binding protein 2 [Paludibacteraceae bacterium]|nr:penicillin-binding protein 2 [Paludibacteraceae bacterium]
MSDNQRHTIFRFAVIFLLVVAGFIAVIVKIGVIQTREREQWLNIAKGQVKTNQPVAATRGNILDCEGRLLASSMPQYYVSMDTRVEALHQGKDTLFYHNVDTIARGLARIVHDRSAAEYRQIMVEAFRANKGKGKIINKLTKRRITYTEMKEIKELPLVKRGVYKSGIDFVNQHRRVKPFGSLASRTIGSIYGEGGYGNAGLEKRFDKELAGTDGISTRQRVGGRWENVTVKEEEDGIDVVTTINADLQDIVETALRERLELVQGDWGCCMLMETQSGHIKAIANLDRNSDGTYSEMMNHAVTRVEPGSTFKTIALMAALDDNKFKLYDTVSVTREPWVYMGKSKHTDSHPKDTIYTVRSALAISSNQALAKIITRSYEGSARKFVKRIGKMGLMDSLYCEIPGAQNAWITVPNDTVTLSKMAYGYSVLLTPLQIMAFYNGIANDGRMIRPMLVSELRKDGLTVKTYETETIRSSMCKKSTLHDIRECLHDVVWDNNLGTASVRKWNGKIVAYKAQSDLVSIAGKTGTAQMIIPHRGYSGHNHRMTFVGYFPEEHPQYTCICMIENPKNYPAYDAGYDCGGVVRQIAEKTIAYSDCYGIEEGKLILERR